MALDIGEKRIGIAVSDPFNSYALPVQTYHRKNLKCDIAYIVNIVKEKRVTELVCGLPLNLDGTKSQQTDYTQYFIDRLKENLAIPVTTADERCTTVEAHRVLIEEDYSRQKRKQFVDALAATYILEGFLRNKSRNSGQGE